VKHVSLGIICKIQEQAEFVFDALRAQDVHLLTPESSSFYEGVIVTTAHLAKGLEFDRVIIPFTSANNYRTDVDKSMLYIACTRAMHELTLTYAKACTAFIKV
jgi:DNA helicase-2/ATP-dependent DNA helicase PcrA